MKKIYVLDTNVILSEPNAIYSFDDNDVIIPMIVIEEIDKFKKDASQLGFTSRKFSREIDVLRKKGSLIDGISNEKGGTIRIVQFDKELFKKYNLDLNINDNIIISTACYYKETNPNTKVVLVSRDINVRLKADIIGLMAENYTTDIISGIPKGVRQILVDETVINDVHTNKKISVSEISETPFPNEYFLLKNKDDNKNTAIVRFSRESSGDFYVKVNDYKKSKISGIKPRSLEQIIAMDLLLNPDIKLVSLVGSAGSGKTLISLAVGLQEVIENGRYSKLSVARPVIPMGNDIGFLPGTMEEKLRPWVQPIIDNLEFLLLENTFSGKENTTFKNINELMNSEFVQVEALAYMRGRSIPNQFILIDEAQSLNPFEIKTIISRVGEGSKIVLTGDPAQIDNPYVTKDTNGLVYAVSKLLDSELTGHIVLEKCERSALANLAVEKL